MPAHGDWSEKIKNIIIVEDNKEIHQHTTIPKEACNVVGRRTAWDSHLRYPILQSLIKELEKIIQIFIEKENFDAPILKLQECWINWYKKNDHAIPHIHPSHLSLVYFVPFHRVVLSKSESDYSSHSSAVHYYDMLYIIVQ